MKRIALISEHASPLGTFGGADSGGQNVYVGQVAKHLAVLGYEVDIFTRRDCPKLPEIISWNGVRIIHVPAGASKYICKEELLPCMEEFTAYVLNFCQSTHYDLIHANFWMSAMVAAEVKRSLGIPFVVTFHALGRVRRFYQGKADGFPDARFAIEDRIVAEADFIIAECPQDQEDLLCLYHANPEKIAIIPCGFDPSEFYPIEKTHARAFLGLNSTEPLILQLGRLVPRKGVDTAICGFAKWLQQNRVSAQLLIVGGESETPDASLTPEIGRLRAIARRHSIEDQVRFVGRKCRDLLKYYYSAADVFITTPIYEPFGITPIEAMACGTPVIGSRVGGVKFTVKDEETGYLVPAKNPQAIADKLTTLYANPHRDLMSQQAIHRAQEYFTWQQVTHDIAALYTKIIQNHKPVTNSTLVEIDSSFAAAIDAFTRSRQQLIPAISQAAQAIFECVNAGGKVLVCGNGGSAADAQHFAAELVGRFRVPHRAGVPILALTADTAFLTAWANDVGFEYVFSRQVETFAKPGDLLLGISTSGRSPNMIAAFKTARSQQLRRVALLGNDGGELLNLADIAVVVPAFDTQRIQEVQIFVLHLLCELVEQFLLQSTQDLRLCGGKEMSFNEPY
ncbi:glycosyltransferase [Gloeocapsopsis crepidinum LEGE 06123]|uniref:Phosphoheptose isomerase n=1 Tax=Gloeocapsopsis crepidinum LEGE 06123 TaxID=588587 RepID=A0ABR9UKW0_9CHRO|nr:glycosyltransferase [Gloeocapsopsis crepidinum]MBE9188921.1 glycosyltransferase [Gloeocapsopsis crepidinum LEGE 06123]